MRPGSRDWTRQVLVFCVTEVPTATESLPRAGLGLAETTADSKGHPCTWRGICWSKEPGARWGAVADARPAGDILLAEGLSVQWRYTMQPLSPECTVGPETGCVRT